MTVIAALVQNDVMVIGGDRGVSGAGTQMKMARPKVWIKGTYMFGYSGSSEGQHVQSKFTPPTLRGDTDTFMQTTFLVALDKFYDRWKINREQEDDKGMIMVIGVAGYVYEHMPSEMSMERYASPWMAVGSGADFALGSLHTTQTLSNPKTRMKKALEAACEYSTDCSLPIDILTLPI